MIMPSSLAKHKLSLELGSTIPQGLEILPEFQACQHDNIHREDTHQLTPQRENLTCMCTLCGRHDHLYSPGIKFSLEVI